MRTVKQSLLITGSLVLSLVILAIAAPRTAHAVGAALVQIANTTANPVPVSNVAPTQMFETTCDSALTFRDNINECFIQVPAGKRLVVQTISVHADVDPGVRVVQGAIVTFLPSASPILWLNVPFTGTFPSGSGDVNQMTQEVKFYANGGSNVECSVLYNTDTLNNNLRCTVVGYLVNQP